MAYFSEKNPSDLTFSVGLSEEVRKAEPSQKYSTTLLK